MALTVRTRLTIWYVTLLTVSLIGFGGVFSYSLLKIFIYRIDSQIISVAEMMEHTVIRPSGQVFLPGDFEVILERFFGIRTAGFYIQVLDPHGQIVAKSANLQTFSLPITRDTYHGALGGVTSYEVFQKVGKYPIRVVTKPIMRSGKVAIIVQVGSSLEGMDEIFHSLAYILISAIFASVAVASAVGWFLAKKALRPVTEITKLARKIEAENLNERITIDVPRDEIGQLAITMNEMIERLEKSFNQIKQFTADASHELKTPLTILKGEMEIALRSKGGIDEMRRALTSSLEEIDRMNYIVRNLLDLAKMDVERGRAATHEVSLDRIVSERCEHFRRHALDSGVGLAILKNSPVLIRGDSVRISQLVYNLIDNALKYTPSGGHVEVMLTEEEKMAVLRVADTGIGISGEDIPYLFDRFYRVDKARSGGAGGAGLGLSICKEIVESNGGTITVSSVPGKGTTFTVRLPVSTDEERPDSAQGATKIKPGGSKA